MDVGIGRFAMFAEEQVATRLQNAAHASQRGDRIRNRAQRIRYQYGVHGIIVERYFLAGQVNQFDIDARSLDIARRRLTHAFRRFEAEHPATAKG